MFRRPPIHPKHQHREQNRRDKNPGRIHPMEIHRRVGDLSRTARLQSEKPEHQIHSYALLLTHYFDLLNQCAKSVSIVPSTAAASASGSQNSVPTLPFSNVSSSAAPGDHFTTCATSPSNPYCRSFNDSRFDSAGSACTANRIGWLPSTLISYGPAKSVPLNCTNGAPFTSSTRLASCTSSL